MDSSSDGASLFAPASTSSFPGLTGRSDSDLRVYVPISVEGLDSRKRLYSKGEYLSKLDSSLLGGGLLGLNVLGWMGVVR